MANLRSVVPTSVVDAITSGSVEQLFLSSAQIMAALESNPAANPDSLNLLNIVFNDNDTVSIGITMQTNRRIGPYGEAVFDAAEYLATIAGQQVSQQDVSAGISPEAAPAPQG